MFIKEIPNVLLFKEVRQILSEGGSVELGVKGESMRPFLRSNKDVVVLSPFRPEELKPGTIILFAYYNKHLLHRIVEAGNKYLLIQGDGCMKNYEKVQHSDVIGIVRTVIRSNGKAVPVKGLMVEIYWRLWYLLRPWRHYLLTFYDKVKFYYNAIYKISN